MNDIGLSVSRGESTFGPQPLVGASKRNIGVCMARERGAENTPMLFNTSPEDELKFGGYIGNSYGHILIRNLIKNAKNAIPNIYGVRILGAGSLQASLTATIPLTVAVNLTVMAGQLGKVDKGTWGNNLSFNFYYKGAQQKNKWVLNVYYKGALVETWANGLCSAMQAEINEKSNYIIVTFSGEPAIGSGLSTVIPGATIGTGTISTTTSGTAETKATATLTVTTAGTAGNTITAYHQGTLLGSYTVQTSDTPTLVATGLKNNINLGTHGYTATSAVGVVTVTGPTGSGSSINTTSMTIVLTGTTAATNTAFTGGVASTTAGTSATVTGLSTTFLTQAPVGSALYTSTGQYIGKVSATASDTSLTLTAVAQVAMSVQGYIVAPFGFVNGTLAGGTYVAPLESDFYPVPGVAPKGLACLDGQDVQLVFCTEFPTLTMATAVRNYCSDRSDCTGLINLPLNPTEATIASFGSTLQSNNENFCAGYNCWIKTDDGIGNSVIVPAIGAIIGAAYLRTPKLYGDFIHIPPGGVDSNLIDCSAIYPETLTPSQLNRYTRDYTVNSVLYQKGVGFYVATSRTYSTKALYHSIHVLLQTNVYVKTLANGMTWITQKNNSPELKRQIFTTLYAYFKTEYDNGALERSLTFPEACGIIVDQSNNPTTQDRKELNADVLWIPSECVEAAKISLKRNDGVLLVKTIN